MVLCMPDMKLPNSDLGIDGAYERLEQSLKIVRARLGDDLHARLTDMARDSKRKLEEGQLKEGLFLLQDMRSMLNKKA